MTRQLTGKILISALALFTGVSAHVADMSPTHIYNPDWPPHAKFHNGQTLAFAALSGLAALWFLWRSDGDKRTNVAAAVALAGLYWATQSLAILYPNTAFFDPQFDHPSLYVLGLPVQMAIQTVALIVLIIATPLALAGPNTPRPSAGAN